MSGQCWDRFDLPNGASDCTTIQAEQYARSINTLAVPGCWMASHQDQSQHAKARERERMSGRLERLKRNGHLNDGQNRNERNEEKQGC
jgi:hypothetical protein